MAAGFRQQDESARRRGHALRLSDCFDVIVAAHPKVHFRSI